MEPSTKLCPADEPTQSDVNEWQRCAALSSEGTRESQVTDSTFGGGETDEDYFVDALDNLTLDPHVGHSDVNNAELLASDVTEAKEMASDEFVADLLASDADSDEEDSNADVKGKAAATSEVVIDEEVLKEQEASLTEEEKQLRRQEALRLKELGNLHFTESRFEAAVIAYTDALAACLLCHATDRAIIYSNRAAAKMRLDENEAAITDCTKALEYNPDYIKALLRRAELYEKTDKLDEALEDYTKALERDRSLHVARAACMRLPDRIKERNEKMKEEMLSKLKDLGNMILRPFGLSTSNFKLQQDPATGSYSVNFQQNPQQNGT